MNELYSEEQLARFKELVISDIKGESDQEIKNYLNTYLYIWLYTLQSLRRDVELQISCQNAKLKMDLANLESDDQSDADELKAAHYRWKMSVLKFLKNIESKTLYVKMIIQTNNNNKKTLEQYKGVNDAILASSMPTESATADSSSINTKSPVGSVKAKKPTAKTVGAK